MLKQPKDFIDHRPYKSLDLGQLLVVASFCLLAIAWAGWELWEAVKYAVRMQP